MDGAALRSLVARLGRWGRWPALGLLVAVVAALVLVRPEAGGGVPPAAAGAGLPVAGETYLWKPVAIGAGGFVTGLSLSRDGRTRVIRTDVGGAYLWDEGRARWTPLFTAASVPAGDRAIVRGGFGAWEAVVAPGEAERLYLAIKGRFFRSDDRGRHWREPGGGAPFPLALDANGPARLSGPFVAVAPDDPDRLLLGTPKDGLWRSADGGVHWERAAEVPASATGAGIVVGFVAAPGGRVRALAAPAGHGVYLEDASGRFAPLPARGAAPKTIARIAQAPNGELFAVETDAQKAWRYRGGTWSELAAAGLPQARFAGVAADPHGRTIYVTDAGGKAWCSADGGDRFAPVGRSQQVEEGGPGYLRANNGGYFASGQILFDPVVANRLWVAAGVGPYRAETGGGCVRLDWTTQVRGLEEVVANDATQPPGGAPLFAGWDFGIHRKPDLDAFSTSYGPKMRSLIAAQQVEWSGGHPRFLVTNASDTRMDCCSEDGESVLAGWSDDEGVSWRRFASLPTPPSTKPTDPWRMAFGTIAVAAGDVDDIVWEPAFNRAPFFTQDRGAHWTKVTLPGEVGPLTGSYPDYYNGRKTLAADRVAPRTFYLVHSGEGANAALAGLWRSQDGGQHWTRLFAGHIAPYDGGPARLRAMPGQAGRLFFTSGVSWGPDTRLRRSDDGGARWRALDGVDQVDDVAFGKAARGKRELAIYISGRVGGHYGIWRSVDDAATWQRVADLPAGRLDQPSVVEADKDVFGRVYVGYSGTGWLTGAPERCPAASPRPGDDRACAAVEPSVRP
ncbi:WD40/YVTN/BNR-like repeat-containing protein [Sphingomonas sp.]|uniref:WD40/YVTN/BNR-like repeat-containing protein n=1 Tax=Sphingomonas sp. TaxID=28214 RepID=UPI003AFF8BB3